MSFRRRNVAVGGPSSDAPPSPSEPSPAPSLGARPSPVDGRPTTSTGTQTLDDLFGGHAGLPLGHSLLIEENGTTDFAGAILRFYAAEGVVQGHQVHAVGVGEPWGRDLPGVVGASKEVSAAKDNADDKGKMKIAWRYERLGEFGETRTHSRPSPAPSRAPPITVAPSNPTRPTSVPQPQPFIHSFDLTKRLTPPPTTPQINYIPLDPTSSNPYTPILASLTHSLTTNPPTTLHRLLIPTLLSPALYPPHSCTPTLLLPFLHSLRALLRLHPGRLTAILTLPLSLHPRSQGLTRWIEHLADGVLELAPFPYSIDLDPASAGPGKEDKAQGMVKVHRLPVVTEKGCGSGMGGGDLAFALSRRKFVIKPFHLPPVEGDQEAQKGKAEDGEGGSQMPKKGDIEF